MIENSNLEIIKAQRDLAIKLNSADNFDDLLKLCLESAIFISGMDSGGIYIVDKNTGGIKLKSHKGLTKEFVSIGKYYESGSTNVEIIKKGEPLYITSEKIDSLLSEKQKNEKLKSLAILPVKNKDKVIACINVASHTKSEIHQSLILPLETMLAVIGNAIANMLSEQALRQSEEKFSKAFNSTSVLMAISEIKTGRFIEVNNTFLKILGYERDEVIGQTSKELKIFADPDKRDELIKILSEHQKILDDDVEVITKHGEKLVGLFYGNIIKIQNEPHLLTVMQDITKRKNAEFALQQSLHEKNILLKEIHHRVKNNLQIISSLLDLQASSISDKNFKIAIENSQSRIRSMAVVHEMLYNSEDLSNISSKNYIKKLIAEISRYWFNHNFKVDFEYDIDEMNLEITIAVPCALIINELITNSLQHAFKDKNGKINITLKHKDGKNQLSIKDNGVGIDEDIDLSTPKTLGLKLVKILTNQIQGDLEIIKKNGTEFLITF